MRISTPQFYERSLERMLEGQSSLLAAQNRIARGTKLLSPADDPSASQRVLEIDQSVSRNTQYQANADLATSRLEYEDSLLESSSNVLTRVRELALQGRSGQLSQADRRFLAAEVRNRLDELVGLANARDTNGEFLFGGFSTQTPPFARNAAGVVTYSGDQGQRTLRVSEDRTIPDGDNGHVVFVAVKAGNGSFTADPLPANTGTGIIDPGRIIDPTVYQPATFEIRFTAPDTFDVVNVGTGATVLAAQPFVAGAGIAFNGIETNIIGAPATGDTFRIAPSASQSVFATIERLATALETELSNPTVEARFAHDLNRTLTDLDQGQENLLRVRTGVGARLKSLDTQKLVNEDLALQYAQARSQLADLDYTEAAVDLSRQQLALEAAQQAFVRTQSLNLFDLIR